MHWWIRVLLISAVMMTVSCSGDSVRQFGAAVNSGDAIAAGELLAKAGDLENQKVTVKGTTVSTCRHSGRRIGIQANTNYVVNVFARDEAFTFPKEESIGKTAVVTGTFSIVPLQRHSEDGEPSDDCGGCDEGIPDAATHNFIIYADGAEIHGL